MNREQYFIIFSSFLHWVYQCVKKKGMKRKRTHRVRPGFLLVEAMVCLVVLIAFAMVVGQVQGYLVQTHKDATLCLTTVTEIRSGVERLFSRPDERLSSPYLITPLTLEPRVVHDQFEVATQLPDAQLSHCSMTGAQNDTRWFVCLVQKKDGVA